ncbi:MAG: O-antigen ligase family protein [Planctomycetota bacterium]
MNDLKQNDSVTISDTIAFALPCLSFLEIQLVGRLFISEIIMLLVIAIKAIGSGLSIDRRAEIILKLAGVWLFAQIMTDLARQSAFEDYSRGWAKIIFFTANLCFMAQFLRTSRTILIFALGFAASTLLAFLINPNLAPNADGYWKFGYSHSVTIAGLALLIPLRKHTTFCGMGLLSLATVNLLLGCRSMAGLIVATMMIQFMRSSDDQSAIADTPSRVFRVASALILIGVIFTSIYEYALDNAWTEYSLRDKQNRQSGDFGSIFGGRAEIWASSRAIMDSPIIGHGSWAKNPIYAEYLLDLCDYGYTIKLPTESDLIPAHSHIFGAWVEAGVLGVFIWGYILGLTFRAISISLSNITPLSPLVEFIMLSFLWAILFSPLGATVRISSAISITIILWLISEHERRLERL